MGRLAREIRLLLRAYDHGGGERTLIQGIDTVFAHDWPAHLARWRIRVWHLK